MSKPRELPILFNGEMVRAILAGTKTQTRRPIKVPPSDNRNGESPVREIVPTLLAGGGGWDVRYELDNPRMIKSPLGEVGDLLYVRETHYIQAGVAPCWSGLPFREGVHDGHRSFAFYREGFDRCHPCRWRPSIHMPKWASRISLRVTGVEVERLQDISGRDILAEGVDCGRGNPSMGTRWETMQRMAFEGVWDAAYAKNAPWATNPWVWKVSFERTEGA